MNETYDWQVVVFCHNERRRIAACIDAIDTAIGERRGLITVIVNGSTDGSLAAAIAAGRETNSQVQVIPLPLADKAYAINSFLYLHRADARLYFCIDGYVTIDKHTLAAMAERMRWDPVALAASGRALNGRTEAALSASTIPKGGVLRGSCFCLRASFVERIVNAAIRLPIGLYRGDSLLGSMVVHNLDPVHNRPDERLVPGVRDATYQIDSLSPFRVDDYRRQFRRMIRQMRGKVENAAVKAIVHEHGFEALPYFADTMIAEYLATNPVPAVRLIDRPFMALALRHVRHMVKRQRGANPTPLGQIGPAPVLAQRPMRHRDYPSH